MIAPILRAASYGDLKVSRSVVEFSEKMMHDTPIERVLLAVLRADSSGSATMVLAGSAAGVFDRERGGHGRAL